MLYIYCGKCYNFLPNKLIYPFTLKLICFIHLRNLKEILALKPYTVDRGKFFLIDRENLYIPCIYR